MFVRIIVFAAVNSITRMDHPRFFVVSSLNYFFVLHIAGSTSTYNIPFIFCILLRNEFLMLVCMYLLSENTNSVRSIYTSTACISNYRIFYYTDAVYLGQ